MVSYNVYKATSSGAYVEGVCLASDEKPVVGIANGSILYAVDASNGETTRYMYDKETMSWIEAECPCAGGSGGSGSGGSGGGSSEGPLIVTLSGDASTADKTFGEIYDAFISGRLVFVTSSGSPEPGVLNTVTGRVSGVVKQDSSDLGTTFFILTTAFEVSKNNGTNAQASNYPFFVVPDSGGGGGTN